MYTAQRKFSTSAQKSVFIGANGLKLKCQILMIFSVLECKKRKSRSHGKRKYDNIKRKICTEKRLNTFLKDLSLALANHGWHGLFF